MNMASNFTGRHVNIFTGDSNASERGHCKTFTIILKILISKFLPPWFFLITKLKVGLAVYRHLWPVWLYHIFSRYFINGTIFGKKLLKIKYVF